MVSRRNVAVPHDTLVPSARAERRRMFLDDQSGIALYSVAVGLVAVLVLLATLIA